MPFHGIFGPSSFADRFDAMQYGMGGLPSWWNALNQQQVAPIDVSLLPYAAQAGAFDSDIPISPRQVRTVSYPRPSEPEPGYYGGSPETNPVLQPYGSPSASVPQRASRTPMTPSAPSLGLGDRIMAGLAGGGASLFGGGGPIGGVVNLLGGLLTGQRTDPQGIKQAEMLRMYKSLQTDFGLTEPQARAVVMNPTLAKEVYKTLASPNVTVGPSGDILQTGAFGRPRLAGTFPVSEPVKVINAQGQEEFRYGIKPSIGNISGAIVNPAGGGGTGIITGLSPRQRKQQEAEGEARGKSIAGLPVALEKSAFLLDTINKTLAHPGLSAGTGLTGIAARQIPGTPAYDFGALHNQIVGKAFLEAYETLKGGGQITEIEGKKATDAVARLDAAQSEKAYRAALKDLQEVVRSGVERLIIQSHRPRSDVQDIINSVGPSAKTSQPAETPSSPKVGEIRINRRGVKGRWTGKGWEVID